MSDLERIDMVHDKESAEFGYLAQLILEKRELQGIIRP